MNTTTIGGHRLFSRVPFNATAKLRLTDQLHEVTLLDIALKGALAQTTNVSGLALHTSCELTLPLTNDGDVITMSGQIAHLEGNNVGIKCEHIDLSSLTLLRRLLELNTGDASLMDRELSQLFHMQHG